MCCDESGRSAVQASYRQMSRQWHEMVERQQTIDEALAKRRKPSTRRSVASCADPICARVEQIVSTLALFGLLLSEPRPSADTREEIDLIDFSPS